MTRMGPLPGSMVICGAATSGRTISGGIALNRSTPTWPPASTANASATGNTRSNRRFIFVIVTLMDDERVSLDSPVSRAILLHQNAETVRARRSLERQRERDAAGFERFGTGLFEREAGFHSSAHDEIA